MTTVTELTRSVDALRSPERVLHSIATAARMEGMAAPRRVAFDEPTAVAPLPILSLTWPALADMAPWLPFFHADKVHEYRREDGSAHHTAYAEYCGWQLSLNAVETVACTCGGGDDPAHQIGCAALTDAEFAERVARMADTSELLLAAAAIPVIVIDVPALVHYPPLSGYGTMCGREHPDALTRNPHRVTCADCAVMLPTPEEKPAAGPCCNSRKNGAVTAHEKGCAYFASLPVALDHLYVEGSGFACGAKTGFSSDDPTKVNCLDCMPMLPLPRRTPGAALVDNPPPSVLAAAYSDARADAVAGLLEEVMGGAE